MLNIPLFSKKKLILAFEYGVILAKFTQDKNVELTPEIISRCENIIEKEFTTKSANRVALDMIPNLLASLETQ